MAHLAVSHLSEAATRAANALDCTSGEVEQAVVASQLKAGPHCVRDARCTVLRTPHRRSGAGSQFGVVDMLHRGHPSSRLKNEDHLG